MKRLTVDDRGASSIEYGLIAFAIAAAVITIVFSLGVVVNGSYQQSCNQLDSKIGSGNCP